MSGLSATRDGKGSAVKFVGIDLAWSTRANTGVCLVQDGKVLDSALVQSDDAIIDWVAPHVDGPCLLAIDAPLIVNNATGRRPCESALSKCFGKHHAGPHSSNLGLASFAGGVRGERIAKRLGLGIDPLFPPGVPVQRAIEVYPHPALVALFGMDKSLKYKAKRGRSLPQRHAAFATLIGHLESLGDGNPPLDVATSPRWPLLRQGITDPSGTALDRYEDELDAYVCAYIGLHYWTHGSRHCRVVGDTATGYIVTPVNEAQAACLDLVWTGSLSS